MIEQAANERVHAHMIAEGATQLRIDADGMGAAMYDAMVDINRGEYELIRVKGGDPSPDRNAWYNSRAYTYMEFARRMRVGEIDIEADDDDGEHPLCKELAVIEYKFAAGLAESILILSKKEMRDKGIKSPDAADAANYATMWIELDDGMPLGTVFTPDYGGNDGFGIYSSSNSFW